MNRILFEKHEISDGHVAFSDERAEHVLNVLHGAVGQTLKTGELDGRIGTSVITEIRDLRRREEGSAQRGSGLLSGTVVVACDHGDVAPAPWFDLILAPPRPRALKRLLPQLAALGVGRIVLVGAAKVEKSFWGAQLLREEVYRPLLVEGLMQSGTTAVPEIVSERNIRRYLTQQVAHAFSGGARIIAHPAPAGPGASSDGGASPSAGPRSGADGALGRVVIAVGPEGGWTDEEVGLFETQGFVRYSLGGRILRTDTATIALIAQLMLRYGG